MVLCATTSLRKSQQGSNIGFVISLSVILFFLSNELRTEFAFTSQRADLLFMHYCVLWNISVIHLRFKKQQILRKCHYMNTIFSMSSSWLPSHQAIRDKSRHLIVTGYAENMYLFICSIS